MVDASETLMTTEDAERTLNQTDSLNNRVLSLTEQVGKLHEILSNEYITEQESITNTLPNLTTHLQELKDSTSNFDRFLENAHKYTEINELTPELLHTFIKRIEIGERAKKYSHSAPQDIVIHYRDIDIVDDMPQELEDILRMVDEMDGDVTYAQEPVFPTGS